MQIGLFCGSFNPIHNGHVGLAKYILEHSKLEEIWLVISPNNPLKAPGTLLDEHIRLELAEMALHNEPNIRPCDREFTLSKPNYTVNTLRTLSREFPDDTFTLIIGSDNMAIFDRWREWEYIIANYPIIVYPREGDDIGALQKQYPKMQVVEAPLFPISATQIRRKICQKEDIHEWVHPSVEQFLQKNAHLFANIN